MTSVLFLVSEASGILKVRALKDLWNLQSPTALNIRAGDVITVRTEAGVPLRTQLVAVLTWAPAVDPGS